MAASLAQLAAAAESAEQKLKVSAADENVPLSDLTSLIEGLRHASEALVFSDLRHASERDTETRLWTAHSRVNARFRKELGLLQRDRSKAVEIRKLLKHYLQFLKSSQKFYRGYILRLDGSFGGIPELRQVAQNWAQDGNEQSKVQSINPAQRKLIVQSCYNALIRLGDLSRYREIELNTKERNWGPAFGYYSLAVRIIPESGIAYNQQAVIALADGNHLRVTYHLYRSLSVKEPHPSAKDNLELEFKKRRAAWSKDEPDSKSDIANANGASKSLVQRFVRYHSKCYEGKSFPEHERLESEILKQLAEELKERSLEGKLEMFVIVNLAAEFFAATKLQDSAGNQSKEVLTSYFFFLRLNVRTFTSLLRILHDELQGCADATDLPKSQGSRKLSDRVSSVARRVLPGIRLYSSWIVANWALLAGDIPDEPLNALTRQLWADYADTLSALAAKFPAQDLPAVEYMLEEDVDTIEFRPLISDMTKKVWWSGGLLKPKFSDQTVERHHPSVEMLVRIRGILIDGLQLAVESDAPLALEGSRFIYQQTVEASKHQEPAINANGNNGSKAAEGTPKEHVTGVTENITSNGASSECASVLSNDAAMHRMVDDLVGHDDMLDHLEEDESIPPTPPAQTFENTTVIDDTSYGLAQLSAGDFVSLVRKYSQAKEMAEPAVLNTNSSPLIRKLPYIPSLPDQSPIWNPHHEASAPTSPLVGAAPRASPVRYPTTSPAHSRNQSFNSLRDSQIIPSSFPVTVDFDHGPAYLNGYNQPELPANQQYNHAVTNGHTTLVSGASAIAHDYRMMSPFLFGVGQGPWSSSGQRSQSMVAKTPRNGQGG